jgi:uncharacterized SAM-binding protein YcdF (DUF218 family)
MKVFKLTRVRVAFLLIGFIGALLAGYFVMPEILIGAGRLLIAEAEPFQADAIVILGGGGPERSREAADLYGGDLAPRIVLTTPEPPDNYRDLERLGIDLFLPYENDLRVLAGFGVPDEAIVRIEAIATETMDELTLVRDFAREQGWSRLIIVTSNYHTRRVLLITRYLFEGDWQVGVIGSRYTEFRPDGWWREVGQARTFFIEFQKLVLYELYLRPRIWF